MPKVKDEYWIELKGKRYPTYPGVLVAAHEEGLLGIEVQVLQYPTDDNQHTAVCQATVTMRGFDGRELVYTEIGDAGPKTCSPMIALASLRMAATRAKGRALRDAIALGVTLAEEIPDDEIQAERYVKQTTDRRARHDPQDHAERTTAPKEAPPAAKPTNGSPAAAGPVKCADCGGNITAVRNTISTRVFGRGLCVSCGEKSGQQAARIARSPAA